MSKLLAVIFLLVSSAGINSCYRENFNPPEAPSLIATPLPIKAEELMDEYKKDAEGANRVYEGKRLYFQGLTVNMAKPATQNDPDAYFVAGGIMFKPRYIFDLEGVVEGTVVDIVGQIRGYSPPVLVVGDCWIKIVGGNTVAISPGY